MRPAGAGRPASSRRDSAGRDSPGRDDLVAALRPVVEAAGYVLDDVRVTSAGRRSLVRVSVDTDGPGPGIDLDGIAEVSHAVSDALDHDFGDAPGSASGFSGPYVLEVSSPGVDRPLTEPRHWRRAIGRLVQVRVADRDLTGRVRSVTETGVVLESDGAQRSLAWEQLGRGRVQVEFNRPGSEASDADAQEDSP